MLRLGQNQTTRFRRDAWLEINLSNLEFNINKLYSEFQKPLIPVLKADAYGHGANVLVELLDSYDYIYAYAVASIDEALSLREVTKRKILVLGITPNWALATALKNNIDVTVADYKLAAELDELAAKNKTIAQIHLKLDTGMNRIGFKNTKDLKATIFDITKLKNININTAYTHISSPDNKEYSLYQENLFYELLENFDFKIHPCSSKSARNFQRKDFDYVRVGIELYGLDNKNLRPLLSLFARISFVKDIKKDESVSYSQTWTTNKDTKIITLPLGYADGVHRLMSNKISAYYKNTFIKQVGNITMDQMMFDVGDIDAQAGDLVELFGNEISIDDWAQAAQTINYEIVTSLNLRLPKTYTR